MSLPLDAPSATGEELRAQSMHGFIAATVANDDFRLLADNLPTLCWMANADGYIFWYNRRWHEYCGTTPAQMEGWGWQSVHDPAVLPCVLERWRTSIATGAAFEMTFPLRGADGVFRPFLTRVQPVRNEAGQVTRWFGTNTDISPQVTAEAALRAERDRSQGILDSMGEGFTLLDRAFRILAVNAEGLRLDGRPREILVGRIYWEVYPDSEHAELGPVYKRAMAERVPVILEHRHEGPDGYATWLETRAYPIPEGLAVFNRDVTDRKRAEERLRELVGTLDLAAVMVRRLDGTIQFWSRGCERLYGWTTEEVVGRSAHELLRTEFPIPLAEVEAVLLRDDTWQGDLHHVRRDGTPLIVAAYKALRRDEWGRPTAVMESLADVTALRQAQADLERLNAELEVRVQARTVELMAVEANLRQAQKMEAVGQLTAGLAHDFNNLLTGIMGSLELLQARAADGRLSEADHYINAAQGAAKRAAALTHRLLAFSRQQTLDPKPVNVNHLVAGIEELVRRTVGPAITVDVVAADGLWITLIDPGQLESALLNLCINARDAMPDGGRITIETGNRWLDTHAAHERDLPPGQYVSLSVSDTGTGMTPDVAACAFDPFFTTKPIGEGTGLGLSMVYGFVRQSGGQARIYSEPDQGAMVCLYLPRHHDEANGSDGANLATEAVEAPRAAQNRTVLVIDDEPTVRMLVADVLEEELGYTAIEAAEGNAGLKVLRSDLPLDLLITDVGLPGGMNGRQVADVARRVRPGLPVLFITGYAENAVIGNGYLEPGMQVLTKPFTMDALAARIRAIMETR